jgi:enamine deaminase RidA (YjgF/YER057c/UK114 family)
MTSGWKLRQRDDQVIAVKVLVNETSRTTQGAHREWEAGPHLLVSGIVGIDPGTGSLAGDTIQDQTRQALTNCQAVLQAGGAGLDDVIEVGILLTDPADFAGLNEEYARWFPSDPPTRYVAKLGVELPGLLVSIRMTAFIS